ncbi:ankyrin repeat domain-containing protein [Solitalea koreensis]|uniref:Ankyrin repeat n=1 Tax=Solitalea koreensis TaxID=543615 RepID=A0A521DB89_9SPHI|nr:ankyrin repeat domain-containing protein [Solitalea koreensis]SMO68341.1 Ankyrin repeat [Solitalea koreensis]
MERSLELIEAIESCRNARVQELLIDQPTLVETRTQNGISILMLAVYHRNIELIKLLLRGRKQLNIHEASALNETGLLDELLDCEPKAVNSFSPDGFTPLGLACFFDCFDTAKLLIENGANINMASQNDFKVAPIHSAVASQNCEVTQLLILHKANVNVKQMNGVTPLHSAAHSGNRKIVDMLLQAGAEKYATMEDGRTPLDMAKEKQFHHLLSDILA